MTDERRHPGRPREARVDSAVAKATLEEIREKGLGGATIEAIAARAGVGKATIYRRWPNKDALFLHLASQLTAVYLPIDTGDLRKDLMSLFEPLVEEMRQGGMVATLMPTFIAEAARDDHIRELLSKLVEDARRGAIQTFQRAFERGEIRADVDIELLADMLAGCFTYRSALRGLPVTRPFVRKVINQVIELAG